MVGLLVQEGGVQAPRRRDPSSTVGPSSRLRRGQVRGAFGRYPRRMAEKEPVPTPVPPVPDGPREVEDAAEQESEYPSDETDEG